MTSCALCDWHTLPDYEGNADLELDNHLRYQHTQPAEWYPLVVAAVHLGLMPAQGHHSHDPEDLALHAISDEVDDWALEAQTQTPAAKARILGRVAKIRRILARVWR